MDMHRENGSDERFVPYDDVQALLPFESLPDAAVSRDATAAAVLRESESPRLEVAACSMATGYKLATMPLTVVALDALPSERRERLDSAVEPPLESGGHVVFGRDRERNHSLREYA